MATNMNRIVLSVPEDIEEEVEQLKQSMFYNTSYAEVYRQAIRLGLERMAKSGGESAPPDTAPKEKTSHE